MKKQEIQKDTEIPRRADWIDRLEQDWPNFSETWKDFCSGAGLVALAWMAAAEVTPWVLFPVAMVFSFFLYAASESRMNSFGKRGIYILHAKSLAARPWTDAKIKELENYVAAMEEAAVRWHVRERQQPRRPWHGQDVLDRMTLVLKAAQTHHYLFKTRSEDWGA